MVTLIQAAQAAAAELQIIRPQVISTSNAVPAQRWARCANKAAVRVAKETLWPALMVSVDTTAVAGVNQTRPADLDRMVDGTVWFDDYKAIQPVSIDEWERTRRTGCGNVLWRLTASAIQIVPAPVGGEDLSYTYITSDITSGGSSFTADSDTFLLDGELLIAAMVLEWAAQEGLPTTALAERNYRRTLVDVLRGVRQESGTMTAPPIGTGRIGNGY